MKKEQAGRKLAVLALAATAAISLSACSSQAEDNGEERTWNLKFSNMNGDGDFTDTMAKRFIELVEEKTEGTVQIELYANSSLTGFDIEPLQAGIADFLQYTPSSAADLDSRMGAFDAPYIYDNLDHQMAVFDPENSEPLRVINESLKEHNVILLSSATSGDRQLTCNFPIYNLDDMRGAKIRVVPSDLYIQLFTALGAAATPMAFSEVPTSLITNVIDGQENAIFSIVNLNIYELQKYVMMTRHMPSNHGIFMNYETYSRLSERQQKAVRDAAYEAVKELSYEAAIDEQENLEFLEEKGITIIDEENGLDLPAFRERAETIYDLYADQWGDMVDLIKSVEY